MVARNRPPIPVTLVLPPEPPTPDEIDAVLMATDAIVMQAGRAGVTLILKGSRSKKALAQGWEQLPDYARLSHLTSEEIARKVDWCIHHDWLRIEYDRDIPLLVHSSPRLGTCEDAVGGAGAGVAGGVDRRRAAGARVAAPGAYPPQRF